jgi:hypothetical protein
MVVGVIWRLGLWNGLGRHGSCTAYDVVLILGATVYCAAASQAVPERTNQTKVFHHIHIHWRAGSQLGRWSSEGGRTKNTARPASCWSRLQ